MSRSRLRMCAVVMLAAVASALAALAIVPMTVGQAAVLVLAAVGVGGMLSGAASWVVAESPPAARTPLPAPERPRAPASELLEGILGAMFDGVLVVDEAQHLLFINRSARDLLEVGSRAVVGRLLSEVSRSSPLQSVIEQALNTGQQQQAEFVLLRQRLTLHVSAGTLNLDSTRGVLVVLHDVTELRRLERMRREFVSNVSHELKTPLTSIQAYADTLLDAGGLDDPQHNRMFVQRIAEQAERLRTLILDLLRLARIESDDVAFEIDEVDATALIRDCLEDRTTMAAAKSLTLMADCPAEPVLVDAEGEGLRTILDNLVDNAIHYTLEGGRVTVSCRTEGDEVCLEVADTGVGIPKEHQERVFERFYRVDRARSRLVGGTGLGLAIVKHLTQAFQGRLELESELGSGSRFRIWLPATRRPASGAPTIGDAT
ncbi:MAG: PAS domain-containing protein [Planctomyces sp.]|nr:PAS domain-containing protein [Planctomyces sp.]